MQAWDGGKSCGCAERIGMLLRAEQDGIQVARDFLTVKFWYELDRTISKYVNILEKLTHTKMRLHN